VVTFVDSRDDLRRDSDGSHGQPDDPDKGRANDRATTTTTVGDRAGTGQTTRAADEAKQDKSAEQGGVPKRREATSQRGVINT
jgi:hypothetical protein